MANKLVERVSAELVVSSWRIGYADNSFYYFIDFAGRRCRRVRVPTTRWQRHYWAISLSWTQITAVYMTYHYENYNAVGLLIYCCAANCDITWWIYPCVGKEHNISSDEISSVGPSTRIWRVELCQKRQGRKQKSHGVCSNLAHLLTLRLDDGLVDSRSQFSLASSISPAVSAFRCGLQARNWSKVRWLSVFVLSCLLHTGRPSIHKHYSAQR